MRFARFPLALCAAAVLPAFPVAAQSVTAEDSAKVSLQGQRYVAIGSSFAAGPMLPPAKPGSPARCGQSMSNYPTLLAERFGMVLVDRSCSGATTDHVLGPWGDIPPQIAAITPETRLVTITIGGNDVSYIGNLFSATCSFNAKAAEAAGAAPKACGDVRVPTEDDYLRDEKQMKEIARRIRETAPKARIVFVQYLNPLPAPGSLCQATPISESDAETVREIGRRLAEITDRVALTNKAIVVEMNQSSSSHTPCDPEPWMIGSPKGYDGKQGLQWHLNKAGMKATADGIAYWLNEAGTKPATPMPTVEPVGTNRAPRQAPSPPATIPATSTKPRT